MLNKVEALFVPAPGGSQRLYVFHAAHQRPARGAIVHVHPFAEEMNKSRWMAAQQSRLLAAAGFDVLQADLLGCGDSSGDFADASWSAWLDDVIAAAHWLRERSDAPIWLWGLRAGCLLAAQAVQQLPAPVHLLFWQPATSGRAVLQQFLRLRVAAEQMAGTAKGAMEALRRSLADGDTVDVAGYTLPPALASGLEAATLEPWTAQSRLVWLEVSPRAGASWSPASAAAQAAWGAAGWRVGASIVEGPAFWQSTESEVAPMLFDATCGMVGGTA